MQAKAKKKTPAYTYFLAGSCLTAVLGLLGLAGLAALMYMTDPTLLGLVPPTIAAPAIAAAPTYTRYPTYTPLPTYTQAPTYTPTTQAAPTDKPVPTLTPIVMITAIPSEPPSLTSDPLYQVKRPGIYLVHVDIAPGVWRSEPSSTDRCYWKITDRTGDIIENHLGQSGGTMYVPANAFQVELRPDCGNWTYLGPP